MAKNNLGILSFVLAAIGVIFIIFSLIDIKSTNYQSYTEVALMFLIASVVTRWIVKQRMKQSKPGI